MLLAYAAHVAELFRRRGVANVSVRAVYSCVSVNGRRAQALFLPEADLLDARAAYTSLHAEWSGFSGVGRFLHPWRSAGLVAAMAHLRGTPLHRCPLREPPPHQRESDRNLRWLYGPLYSRPNKADWPWHGRSRLPPEGRDDAAAPSCAESAAEPEDVADADTRMPPPAWATACSYLHASSSVWCPEDARELPERV